MTPPVVFNNFPLPVTHLIGGEPPRDRLWGASLHFRDCSAVILRRHGGGGGATAGARRRWRCYCGPCTVPRRSWRCRGDPTVDWPNTRWHRGSVEHVQSFFRATAKVRGFEFSAVLRRSMTESRRSWRCHCGLCRTSTAVAPGLRCDGGIRSTLQYPPPRDSCRYSVKRPRCVTRVT